MRIHYIQHVPFETPGFILDWAGLRRHTVHGTHLYRGEACPPQNAFDWLILMGGPMGVHDEPDFPWLAAEKQLLREAIAAGKVVLGICLGAQLLAQALGASVYRNHEREIGWFPITRVGDAAASGALATLPDTTEVLHWHGDTFDLPRGAIHAFSSAGCVNQAFVFENRLFALQFHLEVTWEGCRDLITHSNDALAGAGCYVQSARVMLANEWRFDAGHHTLIAFLDAVANIKRS